MLPIEQIETATWLMKNSNRPIGFVCIALCESHSSPSYHCPNSAQYCPRYPAWNMTVLGQYTAPSSGSAHTSLGW